MNAYRVERKRATVTVGSRCESFVNCKGPARSDGVEHARGARRARNTCARAQDPANDAVVMPEGLLRRGGVVQHERSAPRFVDRGQGPCTLRPHWLDARSARSRQLTNGSRRGTARRAERDRWDH